MSIEMRSRTQFATGDALPFVVCGLLIYVPYFWHEKSSLFNVDLVVGPLQHSLYGAVIVIALMLAAYGGARLGRAPQRFVGQSEVLPNRHFRLAVWVITAISLLAQCAQLAVGLVAYMGGGFVEARAATEFRGSGGVIRLTLITLPILFYVYGSSKWIRGILLVVIVLGILRAFVMSERTAVVEGICLLWVYLRITRKRVDLKLVLLCSLAIAIFFAVVLQARLVTQSKLGASVEAADVSFAGSLAAYYADTTNKFYQAVSGDLSYPGYMFLVPIKSLYTDRKAISDEYARALAQLEGFSPFISTALNNPGGLAEDVSDFGAFAPFVVLAKFGLLGFLVARSREGMMTVALSVISVIAVVEYPRFNYMYMPFAAYLFVAAVLLGWTGRIGLKKRVYLRSAP